MVYSDNAVCGGSTIANSVDGTERDGDKCHEQDGKYRRCSMGQSRHPQLLENPEHTGNTCIKRFFPVQ